MGIEPHVRNLGLDRLQVLQPLSSRTLSIAIQNQDFASASLDRQWHPRPHLFRPIVATHQQKIGSLQLLLS